MQISYQIFMQEIVFYNTLTKRKDSFFSLTGKNPGDTVTMYNCGPTVYSDAHIGNLSAYLMADLIRRFLELRGYNVKQVKNITDVGHLVSDGDTGEDKLDREARKQNVDPLLIAKKYEELYIKDEKRLNMLEPFKRPRATETIIEMIEMIISLEKKGYTYETKDGVYFDVEKFKEYGQLSGNTLEAIRSGARIEINNEKKNPADFALWKKLVGENENHILKWSSPWGEGFPGWHIECSAMASKYLGPVIDIHTGGEDNIFPHHECEIAQSCGVSGIDKFALFWIHKRHIKVEGEKMSKSLGNFYTLSDLVEKGIEPLDFRVLMMMSHYRKRSNFTRNGINAAKKFKEKFLKAYSIVINEDLFTEIHPDTDMFKTLEQDKREIDFFLNDDLNTPGMFTKLYEVLDRLEMAVVSKLLSKELAEKFKSLFDYVDKILAILPEDSGISEIVSTLVKRRRKARENKDWAESDRLRDEILKQGFLVEDTSSGQIIKKK
jgi:cysteinyl-tRNA synthetase